MKTYNIDADKFVPEYMDALEKVFFRMGWMPERDSDKITISVPDADEEIFYWISESDLF